MKPFLFLVLIVGTSIADYARYEEVIKMLSGNPYVQKEMQRSHEKAPQGQGEPGIWYEEVVSEQVPTSVQSLRPGDIKAVAALGDSYTVSMLFQI